VLDAFGTYRDSSGQTQSCFTDSGVSISIALEGSDVLSFTAFGGGTGIGQFLLAGNGESATFVNGQVGAALPCVTDSIQFSTFVVDCATNHVTIQGSGAVYSISVTSSNSPCTSSPDEVVCFVYNPAALLNTCIQLGDDTVSVPVPAVGTEPQTENVPTVTPTTTPLPVCVLGPECVDVPVPGVILGSEPITVPFPTVGTQDLPVTVPTPTGYVEITALCGSVGSLCRVTL